MIGNMAGSTDLSAFILAGGKSTRMGADKAFVTLSGRTLLERVLDLARSVCAEVRIVGDPGKYGSFAPVVEDIFRGCGPLAGIHAALRLSQSDLNLIVAVDVPFLSAKFLHFLIARSRRSEALVTVARTSSGWQPLCAVYRRQFAVLAERDLRSGQFRIDRLFDPATTDVVEEPELCKEGFTPDLFRNLNSPEDLSGFR